MRKHFLPVVVIFAVVALIGLLVAASGIMPITASSGHWPITEWVLGFSMDRSVSFHARNIEVPELDDPAMILRGAGHYESGCAWCHGSPSLHEPRMVSVMTPEAPDLEDEIHEWKPRELFYIVKYGVKFTGMPGWPAPERDDEVWSIVAFLLRLPELDASEYQGLVWGESGPPSQLDRVPTVVTRTCARCHGVDGTGRGNAAFPRLAGQNGTYMINALEAYARGDRHSGIMGPIAASLSASTIREVARYYQSRDAESENGPLDEASIERGERIALNEHEGEKPCTECHHPDTKDEYPNLDGQYADYIVQQLELFAERKRGGSEHAKKMLPIAPKLTEQERRDVATYFASLSTFDLFMPMSPADSEPISSRTPEGD